MSKFDGVPARLPVQFAIACRLPTGPAYQIGNLTIVSAQHLLIFREPLQEQRRAAERFVAFSQGSVANAADRANFAESVQFGIVRA